MSLQTASRSRWYWLSLILIGVGFIGLALYYQYALDEQPCRFCIIERLWITGVVLVALCGLLVHVWRWPNLLAHLLTLVCALGMAYTAYQLLGTERGFTEGECSIVLDLGTWFRPDVWLPQVFKVQTPCGYTPLLPFGISMAEALSAVSALFVLVALVMTIGAASKPKSDW